MQEMVVLQNVGLKTNPSYITTIPGAMAVASNIVIDSANICTSRRGFSKFSELEASVSGTTRLMEYGTTIMVCYDNKIAANLSGDTFTEYDGTFIPNRDDVGIRSTNNNGSIYVTTTKGVKKLQNVNEQFIDAGMVPAIDNQAILSGNISTGFMQPSGQIAYRVLWGNKDANNHVILGVPSQRTEVILPASGVASDVNMTIYIPSGVTTSNFYQVYRSDESAGVAIPADDELYLVYEDNPTSGEIAAGAVSITDNVPFELAGATLYTSPSQGGILSANYPPPMCSEMCLYKNVTLYANTSLKYRLFIDMIAASADMEGKTITIDGTAYTFKASPIASTDVKLELTLTTSENIQATANALIRAINLRATNYSGGIYAYYISNYDSLPGKIQLERTSFSVDTFYVTADTEVGTNFNPTIPTSGTTIHGDNDAVTNRIYISKPYQSEAVPILNYVNVGSSSSTILRVIPLRDSVFIFMDNGEVYRMIGEDVSSFTVNLFDNTISLIAPKSAIPFNNRIYCMSDQGIIAVSDVGAEIVSSDIQNQMRTLISPLLSPNFNTTGFGFSSESSRRYFLSNGTTVWVFNDTTSSWTTWDITSTIAFTRPSDDKLYYVTPNNVIMEEKKDYTNLDFSDEVDHTTIIAMPSAYNLQIDRYSEAIVGTYIRQGNNTAKIVASSGGDITIDKVLAFNLGAAFIDKTIVCEIEYLPIHCSQPTTIKKFSEMIMLFNSINNGFTVTFENNFTPGVPVSIFMETNLPTAGWGTIPWGIGPWGGISTGKWETRTWFPLTYMNALWQKISITSEIAYNPFEFLGLTMTFAPTTKTFMRNK